MESERRDALKKAWKRFHDGVRLDGHSGQWLHKTAHQGQVAGILGPIQEEGDSQWTVWFLPWTGNAESFFKEADDA